MRWTLGESHRWLGVVGLALALVSCSPTPTTTAPPPVTMGRVVYAALGASDAVGIGAFPVTEGYVYLIRNQLLTAKTEADLHNLGINGAIAHEIVTEELEAAVASRPGVVTVWTGSNDVISGRDPKVFRSALDTILRELRDRTDALVVVGDLADISQAPLFRTFPDPDVTAARVAAFNAEIHASVAAHGAVLVSIATKLPLDDATFSVDGFHPSNRGHILLCELFWAEIRTRLR